VILIRHNKLYCEQVFAEDTILGCLQSYSNFFASLKISSSWKCGAMIWRPTSLLSIFPAGIEIAGSPAIDGRAVVMS